MLPRTEIELIDALRKLATEVPVSPSEHSDHQNRCFVLSMHLAKSGDYSGDVPHVVWHFLSDADVRAKSAEYAEMQRAEILGLVTKWAQEIGA